MCHIDANAQCAASVDPHPLSATVPAVVPTLPSSGSRRRRLWELDSCVHFPVVGVCLPISVLRRIVNKVFRGDSIDNEYDLHSGAVGQCGKRTPLAEGMQRELTQRYVLAVREASGVKTTEALVIWWAQSSQSDLAGALWATLTHPRCSPELAKQVHGEVHMLQHQVGAAQRADMRRMKALLDENAALGDQLVNAQQRNTQLVREHTDRHSGQLAQIMQLRASLITRDTQLAALQDQFQQLEQAVPELACRVKQAGDIARQAEQIQALGSALLVAQQESQRRGRLVEAQVSEFSRCPGRAVENVQAAPEPIMPAPQLENRALLCVGGRTASVPIYRGIIESVGGRFAHHDGGQEENLAKLDSTLAAADLVICQVGCISHNAYWRVNEHCKRTGKPCMFVENTGTACFMRALSALSPPATA